MGRCLRTHPAALLLRVVLSLHCGSALNQSTDTVHFQRFLLCPICTLYILYLKPVRNSFFSITTDWNKRVNVYVQYTLLLCISAVPEHGGDPEKQIKSSTLFGDLSNNTAFRKKQQHKKQLFICISIKTTLLYIEERHFVKVFISYNILLLLRSVL